VRRSSIRSTRCCGCQSGVDESDERHAVVNRPGDGKSLVDAAANALKLVETIKNQSSGKVSREEIAQEMARILAEVEQARMHDVEVLFDAELKKLGVPSMVSLLRRPHLLCCSLG
jgi:hypothetical protein